jgi:hypothetical protein
VSGFIRRYGYVPDLATLKMIEGLVILDLTPPGGIQGLGSGTVAIIGETADLTRAVSVSSAGVVTTSAQPTEIYSPQDFLDKFGGFDYTLGEFGKDGGNLFAEVFTGKKFARLVVVAVNLASSAGVRMYRKLPLAKAADNPAPIVPVAPGIVAAGREFKSAGNRAHVGARGIFTASQALVSRVDGAIANAVATLTSAGATFITSGVQIGDVVALGVFGQPDSDTYRIVTVDSETQLTLQQQNGVAFSGSGIVVALPFRVYPGTNADTAVAVAAANGGAVLPARALDATIAAATECTPTVVPPAVSATVWDTLSGLKLRTHPTTGLVYTAAVQAANATQSSALDVLYGTCLDALLSEASPARDVNVAYTARVSATIRTAARQHERDASAKGIGRIVIVNPDLQTVTTANALADASPGVGATRDESTLYAWPGATVYLPDAVGQPVKLATGATATDGYIDLPTSGYLASVLSLLAPERNPAQAAEPVPTCMGGGVGFQHGAPVLGMEDYIALKAGGVVALRMDRQAGPIFQSGVTSSLVSGKTQIQRRRMANFLEDSAAAELVQFSKLPMTPEWKDGVTSELVTFLEGLKAAGRIADYSVDRVSGNTPAILAAGLFVLIMRVQTTPTADVLVLQAQIGDSVNVKAA